MIKYVYFGNMAINEYDTASGTTYGHANATGAQAVGAARYTQTPAFGTSPPVLEWFSSAGGTATLFDLNGNPVVTLLGQKPEIVAPHGGDTTFFGQDLEPNGYPNFFGTSAAAPLVDGSPQPPLADEFNIADLLLTQRKSLDRELY